MILPLPEEIIPTLKFGRFKNPHSESVNILEHLESFSPVHELYYAPRYDTQETRLLSHLLHRRNHDPEQTKLRFTIQKSVNDFSININPDSHYSTCTLQP